MAVERRRFVRVLVCVLIESQSVRFIAAESYPFLSRTASNIQSIYIDPPFQSEYCIKRKIGGALARAARSKAKDSHPRH